MLEYDTFIGKDFSEALTKMKMALGSDAMMLKKRIVNKSGFLGLFKKPMVEVIGFKSDKRFYKKNSNNDPSKHNNNGNNPIFEKQLDDIKAQLTHMVNIWQTSNIKPDTPEVPQDILSDKYTKLLRNNELSEELTEKILGTIRNETNLDEIEDEGIILEKIKVQLLDLIEVADPLKNRAKGPKVFLFVGPTGVGKTTTLVKLAATYQFQDNKDVEIFSLDNYRIAATEQLKSYSEIMQIPFEVFTNKIDLKNAFKKSKAEIILIDTAGRSPKDEISISTIKDYIKSVTLHTVDTFLVMSASTKKSDIMYISEKYSKLNYKYLIFTKLDETVKSGSIIDALYYLKKPISYVTFGQDVPRHISIVNPEVLVESIIKE